MVDWRANRLVDILAKRGAAEHGAPATAQKMLKSMACLTRHLAAQLGETTFMANNFRQEVVSPNGEVGYKMLRDSTPKPKFVANMSAEPRPATKPPKPKPIHPRVSAWVPCEPPSKRARVAVQKRRREAEAEAIHQAAIQWRAPPPTTSTDAPKGVCTAGVVFQRILKRVRAASCTNACAPAVAPVDVFAEARSIMKKARASSVDMKSATKTMQAASESSGSGLHPAKASDNVQRTTKSSRSDWDDQASASVNVAGGTKNFRQDNSWISQSAGDDKTVHPSALPQPRYFQIHEPVVTFVLGDGVSDKDESDVSDVGSHVASREGLTIDSVHAAASSSNSTHPPAEPNAAVQSIPADAKAGCGKQGVAPCAAPKRARDDQCGQQLSVAKWQALEVDVARGAGSSTDGDGAAARVDIDAGHPGVDASEKAKATIKKIRSDASDVLLGKRGVRKSASGDICMSEAGADAAQCAASEVAGVGSKRAISDGANDAAAKRARDSGANPNCERDDRAVASVAVRVDDGACSAAGVAGHPVGATALHPEEVTCVTAEPTSSFCDVVSLVNARSSQKECLGVIGQGDGQEEKPPPHPFAP